MADARQQKFDGGEARQDPGESVVLTLDEKIQYIAERELAAVIQKVHAPAGSVIVQDPNTGAILALAHWPKYNPNSATAVATGGRLEPAGRPRYQHGTHINPRTPSA